MANLKEIIGWFSIGKTPTAEQFRQSWSSFWHKSEKLPIEQIMGLAEEIAKATTNFKGYHTDEAALKAAYPKAENKKDFFAWVGSKPTLVWKVYENGGDWENTGDEPTEQEIDLAEYAKTETESGKVVRSSSGKIEFTTEITENKNTAPSNYAVKNLENKVFSVDKGFNVIPYGEGNKVGYAGGAISYIYENQSDIQNKRIVQLEINVETIGTISLLRCVKNGSSFNTSIIQQFNLVEVGKNIIDVDLELTTDEYLGFFQEGDTCRILYKQDIPNVVGGGFYYLNSIDQKWMYLNADLSIGVMVNDGSLKTNYRDRLESKAIKYNGVVSNNELYFLATVDVQGYAKVNIQTFPNISGFGGAFFDEDDVYISGYSFTQGEVAQSERKDIPIPNNASRLDFCFGKESVLGPLGIPTFDYIQLDNINVPSLLSRIIELEKDKGISNNGISIASPTQVSKMDNIVYKNVKSLLNPLNSDIEIILSDSVYEDRLYINGDFSQDFEISFNFELENRFESKTRISFNIEKEDGTLITFSRLGQFKLQVKDGTDILTSSVAFEAPILIKQQAGSAMINISNKEFLLPNIKAHNAYFQINADNQENRYFIRRLEKLTKPLSLESYGLMFPAIAAHKKDEYVFIAYYLPNKSLAVAKIDLISKEIESKEFSEVKLASGGGIYDSHNYWSIIIDQSNGIHIMGNCHSSSLYYLYGANCLNLETISVSNKLLDNNATYPDFVSSSNGLFATYRNGSSGNSSNIAFKFNEQTKIFSRTTDKPFADGTNGKGGTAYFGKWIKHDNWFYNAWCWRRTLDAATNNQINLIKTQDFIDFYSQKGDKLVLPITRSNNPNYCIDNVPENSGLINQWFIIPFIFNGQVHVWYMKNDENGNNNIYLVHPHNNGYKTIKITNFNYQWRLYGIGTVDISTIQVVPIDNGDYLVMHIKHLFCSNNSYYIDKDYNISIDDYQLKDALVDSDRYVVVSQQDNVLISAETDRAYHDRLDALQNGVIRIG